MRTGFLLCSLILLLCTRASQAERLTFDRAADWESWQVPYGLVEVGDSGQLQLVKYHKNTNVVADASLFRHATRTRGEVSGGIWEAGSGQATAGRVIDGDPATFWKPDTSDVVGEWFVQVDLGRAVLAKEIRLKFPDQEGARPFRQFTVFIATGVTSDPLDDLFIFDPVYRTTRPNEDSEIVIPLSFLSKSVSRILGPDSDVDPKEKYQHRLLQYINFTVEAVDPQGALAEIEVVGVGDNVSIGVEHRGLVLDGLTSVSNLSLFDANVNTNNAIAPVAFAGRERSWLEQGTWFYADLGAIFWLDGAFVYVLKEQEGTAGFIAGPARGFNILVSDGTRSIGTNLPVPEPFARRLPRLSALPALPVPAATGALFALACSPGQWLEFQVGRTDVVLAGASGRTDHALQLYRPGGRSRRWASQSHQKPVLGRRPAPRCQPAIAFALWEYTRQRIRLLRQKGRSNYGGEV